MDIINKIKEIDYNLIGNFISIRLKDLKNKEEKVIGYNSDTTIYNGFLDKNVRVNFACIFLEDKDTFSLAFGGMKFDDKTIYRYLIEEVRKEDNPFVAVINALDNYLSLRDKDRDNNRSDYMKMTEELVRFVAGEDKTISIKTYKENRNATCAQIAGVAQNMFRFLDIESDYVTSGHYKKENDNHSYNIIYPWGRENDAIIFDAMRSCKSRPFLFLLNEEKKKELFSYNKVDVSHKELKEAYKKLLDLNVIYSSEFNTSYYVSSDAYIEKSAPDLLASSSKHKLVFRKIDK